MGDKEEKENKDKEEKENKDREEKENKDREEKENKDKADKKKKGKSNFGCCWNKSKTASDSEDDESSSENEDDKYSKLEDSSKKVRVYTKAINDNMRKGVSPKSYSSGKSDPAEEQRKYVHRIMGFTLEGSHSEKIKEEQQDLAQNVIPQGCHGSEDNPEKYKPNEDSSKQDDTTDFKERIGQTAKHGQDVEAGKLEGGSKPDKTEKDKPNVDSSKQDDITHIKDDKEQIERLGIIVPTGKPSKAKEPGKTGNDKAQKDDPKQDEALFFTYLKDGQGQSGKYGPGVPADSLDGNQNELDKKEKDKLPEDDPKQDGKPYLKEHEKQSIKPDVDIKADKDTSPSGKKCEDKIQGKVNKLEEEAPGLKTKKEETPGSEASQYNENATGKKKKVKKSAQEVSNEHKEDSSSSGNK